MHLRPDAIRPPSTGEPAFDRDDGHPPGWSVEAPDRTGPATFTARDESARHPDT
ncbi:hypothetical protein Ae168Ps1_2831 [Pseudonocardia sp. Ae168_Ps1]|nr:hypothetical protein Ae150APs1_2823 [Pseudonocardia sp. Ae150A_Ps1]OLL80425.1 hypothetical protein Ae168Ps1_2831 [Pseudonocardia sp. Ae168_Ps1]OLL85448.1 hypothetical protein Ae263Ps1_2503c [Pseudonocardia sp. Ae263_Ps1]OLL94525.1 hypothetical protein Ae356Ps1_4422 [Pseudonocardia sp. Ae356_Ps1]